MATEVKGPNLKRRPGAEGVVEEEEGDRLALEVARSRIVPEGTGVGQQGVEIGS